MSKPLTDAITALTTYANTVTGASDETLSEAVATLANGYGQGGGGSLPNFLEPKEMIGTMTVDENKTLKLAGAMHNAPTKTLVIAFCPTAPTYKVILLWKRANNNVSYVSGFGSTDYGVDSWNAATWQSPSLQAGDIYYLFTGNNF